MRDYIHVGADVHDRSILLKVARGSREPEKRSFRNDPAGRVRMIRELQKRAVEAGEAKIVFAYEASGLGFGLYDELVAVGITCFVLAPSRIARSSKHQREKTDERDAQRLFELVRGHTLAGNELPTVWIPDPQTRDDREIVRGRLDASEKHTRIKTQIRCLLKRNQIRTPPDVGRGWTKPYLLWLWRLSHGKETPELDMGHGARIGLETLLRQFESLQREVDELDEEIEVLSRTRRYARPARELTNLKGVGLLASMVFLTEMGDMKRFCNRRQLASFLGLVPSADESGEADDRKGHITRQGPGRVRKVLCQATWVRVATDQAAKKAYRQVTRGSARRKKVAIVAMMRRLAIRMWHRALDSDKNDTTCRSDEKSTEVEASAPRDAKVTGKAKRGPRNGTKRKQATEHAIARPSVLTPGATLGSLARRASARAEEGCIAG